MRELDVKEGRRVGVEDDDDDDDCLLVLAIDPLVLPNEQRWIRGSFPCFLIQQLLLIPGSLSLESLFLICYFSLSHAL